MAGGLRLERGSGHGAGGGAQARGVLDPPLRAGALQLRLGRPVRRRPLRPPHRPAQPVRSRPPTFYFLLFPDSPIPTPTHRSIQTHTCTICKLLCWGIDGLKAPFKHTEQSRLAPIPFADYCVVECMWKGGMACVFCV